MSEDSRRCKGRLPFQAIGRRRTSSSASGRLCPVILSQCQAYFHLMMKIQLMLNAQKEFGRLSSWRVTSVTVARD